MKEYSAKGDKNHEERIKTMYVMPPKSEIRFKIPNELFVNTLNSGLKYESIMYKVLSTSL
jgi:hypothetical protein